MPSGYVPGYGNGQARLMVVGEAPGADEEYEGKPFVGSTGRMLAEAVDEAGLNWNETYRTNVFKYHPPGNNLKMASMTGHTIEEGIPQLWAERDAIMPNAILAVGDLAMFTLTGKTGIKKYRGSILRTRDGKTKVIPTIHFAELFKERGGDKKGAIPWQMFHVIKGDVVRAVKQSEFKEYRVPIRQHHIARSPAQLSNFLYQHRDKKLAFLDIESLHSIPCCVGIAFDPYSSMTVPFYNAGSWVNSPQALPYSYYVEMWKILFKFFSDPTMLFAGQNLKYDQDKLRAACGFNISGRVHSDTALKAHIIQPEYPVNLAFLTSIYTDEPFYKDEGHEFDVRKDKIEKFFEYNGKDCCVTAEISAKEDKDLETLGLTDFYYGFVNKLHGFYMRVERRGFHVNEDVRLQLIEKYTVKYEETLNELAELAGHRVNVSATAQVKSFLFLKMKLPERPKVDDDTLSLLYANHAKNSDQKRAISLVLAGRRARKTITTYLTAPPDFDGRMRCSWRIGGTETGRSSTSKLKVKRPYLYIKIGSKPLKKVEMGMMFHNMTKHGEVGGDVRRMYEADEGYVIGEADMSQAEARIVALLAGDDELLDLFNRVDIHRLTASWLFGIPIDKVNKIAREIGKRVRHAGNYGMGKRRLTEILAADSEKFGLDLTMSEWKAGKILDAFHRFTPKIRGVYHVEVERVMRQGGILVNAYGRRRQFCGRWEDAMIREGYANIPQGTVPDHLRLAALRIEERIPEFLENGLTGFVNEAHDALVWQSRIEDFDKHAAIIKEEMEKPINFAKCSIPRGELIIPAEVKCGPNYKDLKNYEFKVVA